MQPVEAFAFYLPQFYPVPLNTKWWGEGFTEWTSVLRAHRGHRSPADTLVSPGELGFYDLRDSQVRRRQGELATSAGLSALCVYHYYSAGSRLLQEVEDRILDDGFPAMPFFLGWANHDWTLAWQGRPHEVIARQEYDEHLNDEHFAHFLKAFDDPRYYRVAGRVVLFVWSPTSVPDHQRVFTRWRELAHEQGHDLLLLGGAATPNVPAPEDVGVDAWVQGTGYVFGGWNARQRALRSLRSMGEAWRFARHRDIHFPYEQLMERFSTTLRSFPEGTVPLVVSSWNNTGRRARSASTSNSTPTRFESALRRAAAQAPVIGGPDGARLVAINAWNEWGEGMTMEPSQEFGRGMLDAAHRVLNP